MVQVNHLVQRVNSIGFVDSDLAMQRAAKNLVVYLAIFMSFGGLVWGTLLLYFNLVIPAFIPYGYIILSLVNILNFYYRKNFTATSIIQVTISMLLPFLLQWQLGGFFASGCVMLWSILSLVGSVILLRGRWVYPNLLLYTCFVVFSFFFDPYFAFQKPAILTSEVSLLLLTLNILLIMAIVFVLAKIKVDRDNLIQEELQKLYAVHERNLSIEQEMRKELQISENRYRNLVEESSVLICTHTIKGNIITINKPGAEILGYRPEGVQGKNLSVFLPPEFLGDYHAYLDHIARHKSFEGFMTVLTRKGDKRIFLFRNILVEERGHDPYIMGSAQDVTEWRKSESRERRIKKELQMIVSSIDDFVIEFDEAGRFKNFWCRDESKLSRPTSYYVGKTIEEAFAYAPSFASIAQQVYEKVLLSGKPYSTEVDSGHLPTSLSYLIRLNPIQESDGSVKRCTALVSDITARKLVEKRLQEDHALLRTIIDNLPLNVYVKNGLSQKLIVNKAEWQYLGATNENELIGKSDYELYPDESAQISIDEDKLVLAGQSILGKETINTKNDGTQTHFITSKVPLRDSRNKIIGLVGISVNNTEQKRRELELKKLSAIVEQTSNIIIVTDADGKINWANKSFEDSTGYCKEEVIGRKPSEILQGPHTSKETILYMHECIQKQQPFECEILNYHKNHQSYWVKIFAQPVLDADDKFHGFFSVQREITKEKELIEQLRNAKEEAENSNRLKTIFLGSLSHEVRTPLQGILGFAEVIETQLLSEEKRKQYLGIIKKRTIDLQDIIDSLLDMASLETGEIKPFASLVNLNELVEDVFSTLQQDHTINKKPIKLILKNDLSASSEVVIDSLHFKQVVVNMIKNGIKFTDEGSVTLHCKKSPTDYLFSIEDTGIGIPHDRLEDIFGAFRQAHEGLSRSKGGIGLGLAICKKMVDLWGGVIKVKSEPNKGSVFSFTVPYSVTK